MELGPITYQPERTTGDVTMVGVGMTLSEIEDLRMIVIDHAMDAELHLRVVTGIIIVILAAILVGKAINGIVDRRRHAAREEVLMASEGPDIVPGIFRHGGTVRSVHMKARGNDKRFRDI